MASLAALLVALTGCEPDECGLGLNYVIGGGVYDVAWSSPTATCSVIPSSTTIITLERGNAELELSFPSEPKVGSVSVDIDYRDAEGTSWTSASTFCSMTIVAAEFVEWTKDDHWRVEGTFTCAGPLRPEFGSGTRTLILGIGEIDVYAGEGWYL